MIVMRKEILLVLVAFLIGCNPKVNHQKDVKLITKDSVLIENFKQARLLADSLVIEIFNDKNILSHFNCTYNFEYEGWDKSVFDTLYGKPKEYEFHYDLCLENDTIGRGTIDIDSLKMIKDCSVNSFMGLEKLYEGELKIDKSKARKIALSNGLKETGLNLEFKASDEVSSFYLNYKGFNKLLKRISLKKIDYFWDASNDCNECPEIYINAKNGNIFSRFTIKKHY